MVIDEDKEIELADLSFLEKIYLGTLLREGISEDYNYIKPISEFINPIVPTSEFQSEIINMLIDKKIILIHPNPDSKYIKIIDSETGNFRYNLCEVKWYLNVKSNDLNKVSLIKSIINPVEIKKKILRMV